MSEQLAVVLNVLPKLPPNALKEIQLKTKALLSMSGETTVSSSLTLGPMPSYDYLLEGIYHECCRRGVIAQSSKTSYWKNKPKLFNHKSYATRQLLESKVPPLSSSQEISLGRTAVKCLARFLEEQAPRLSPIPIVINPKSLMTYIDLVPEAIERYFPGYMRSGLLTLILR